MDFNDTAAARTIPSDGIFGTPKALSRTFTGELIDLLNPKPWQIHIEDIAHHLSMACRFAGAVRHFYSVAEHSLNVAILVEKRGGDALGALLHDASEAYLSDINGNLKKTESLKGYLSVEKNFEFTIQTALGLKPMDQATREADKDMLEIEGGNLVMGWNGGTAKGSYLCSESNPFDVPLRCFSPGEAKALFLYRYQRLSAKAGKSNV